MIEFYRYVFSKNQASDLRKLTIGGVSAQKYIIIFELGSVSNFARNRYDRNDNQEKFWVICIKSGKEKAYTVRRVRCKWPR